MNKFSVSLVLFVFLAVAPLACAGAESQQAESQQEQVSLYYFYAEDCSHCKKVAPLLEELEAKFPELEVRRFDLSYNENNATKTTKNTTTKNTKSSSELFNAFIQTYNPPAVEIPAVFVGNKSLIGRGLTRERLEAEVEFCLRNGCPDPLALVKGEAEGVTEGVRGRGGGGGGEEGEEDKSPLLLMLVGTALVEGLNPCGFAVLIFLLASLLSLRTRRSVLGVGLAFVASVVATHFFVGLGLVGCYLFSAGTTTLVRRLVIFVALSAGVLNLHDFWRDKATLAVPSVLKPGIARLAGYASVPCAVLLGFFATMAGLPCTGCIYLTVLGLLAAEPAASALKTVLYLLLYNFFYALPLLLILALIYRGTSPEEVEAWRKGKRRFMKLAGGLVLLGFGTAMLLGLV